MQRPTGARAAVARVVVLQDRPLSLQLVEFVEHQTLVDPPGAQVLDEPPLLLTDLREAVLDAGDLVPIRLWLPAP